MMKKSGALPEIPESCGRRASAFGGRLAEYKYYDMDKVIESAFQLVEKELQ